MSDADSEFCVYVKNLKDGKKSIVSSTEVWEISEVKKMLWRREKISQASLESKRGTSKEVMFGIIDGENMIKHFIIDYAEDRAQLIASVKASRPRDPKRLSISDAAIPLIYFLKYEERANNKAEKATVSKIKRPNPMEKDDILKRFLKKKKCDPEHEPKAESHKQVDSHQESNRFNESTKPPTQDSSAASSKMLSTYELVNVDAFGEPSATTSAASLEMQLAESRAVIEKLKVKIAAVTDQRDQALTEAQALRLYIDDLKTELESTKKALQDTAPIALLKEIAATVRQIPTSRPSSSKVTCNVMALQYACDLEEEFKDFQLPSGMIYVGRGQTVSHKDIVDIEDEHDSFNARAEHVFNLICKDGIQNYSLTAHKNCKASTKPIPEHVQKAVKRILKAMEWPIESVQYSSAQLTKFFHKHPGDVRRRGNAKAKPTEDKKTADTNSKSNDPEAKATKVDQVEAHGDAEVAGAANEKTDDVHQKNQPSDDDELDKYLSRSSPDRNIDDS